GQRTFWRVQQQRDYACTFASLARDVGCACAAAADLANVGAAFEFDDEIAERDGTEQVSKNERGNFGRCHNCCRPSNLVIRIESLASLFHFSLRRTKSNAAFTANVRINCRSPGKINLRTLHSSASASAINTNPTGFSSLPPPGPAMPVMPTPSVVAARSRIPRAIAAATGSLTA